MTRNDLVRLVALGALLGAAACGRESNTPSEVVERTEVPADDVIYGLHHVMTTDGIRTAVLDSDTAFLREAGERFDLQGVQLKFYSENGAESGTLTSRTGEYHSDAGTFVARDSVVLVTQSPDGERRIETEELSYDLMSDKLRSEQPFVMRQNGRVTRGSSFETDSKFTVWTTRGLQTEGQMETTAPAEGAF